MIALHFQWSTVSTDRDDDDDDDDDDDGSLLPRTAHSRVPPGKIEK